MTVSTTNPVRPNAARMTSFRKESDAAKRLKFKSSSERICAARAAGSPPPEQKLGNSTFQEKRLTVNGTIALLSDRRIELRVVVCGTVHMAEGAWSLLPLSLATDISDAELFGFRSYIKEHFTSTNFEADFSDVRNVFQR